MTTIQKIMIGGLVAVAVGAGLYMATHRERPIRGIPPGWSVLNGKPEQWDWSFGRINAHVTDGDSILASSASYGDVTISATVLTPNREASLALRLQDKDNGYIVAFVPVNTGVPWNGGDCVTLKKRVEGKETTLVGFRKGKLPATGEQTPIKAVVRGPNIDVWLNGSKILHARDTTFARGAIGLRVYGEPDHPCDATFSDLRFH
jgi:hypothetical protein